MFIVYTSNIFAVLGLRALCFLVASIVQRLHYLRPALALVLAFVGRQDVAVGRQSTSPTAFRCSSSAGLIGGAAC